MRIKTEVSWLPGWRILDALQQLSLPVLLLLLSLVFLLNKEKKDEANKNPAPYSPPVDQVSSSLFGVPPRPRHLQLTRHGPTVSRQRSPLADNQMPPAAGPEDGKLYISDLASTSLSTQLGNGHTDVTDDGVLRQQQQKKREGENERCAFHSLFIYYIHNF